MPKIKPPPLITSLRENKSARSASAGPSSGSGYSAPESKVRRGFPRLCGVYVEALFFQEARKKERQKRSEERKKLKEKRARRKAIKENLNLRKGFEINSHCSMWLFV